MSRIRLMLLTEALAAVLLLVVAHPAAAQNTVNQTTCGGVSGVGSCLTTGFLQDLTVNCQASFPANQVSTALAQITDRNGPNRITLSGSGCGGVSIVGFNRLTIVGDGSPMGGFWGFIDSRRILLKSMTFDFSVQFGNVTMQGSDVTFDGVTVTNASDASGTGPEFAVGLAESSLAFTGALSRITNNPCVGISVGAGSRLNLANVTVSNNGLGPSCPSHRNGIRVRDGGSVVLSNQINVNGTLVDAPVEISGNGQDGGLDVAGGTLEGHAKTGNAMIRIHDNLGPGLQVLAGGAGIDGQFQFDGNNPNGQGGLPGVQLAAGIHAVLLVGGGVQVQGGLAGFADAFVGIGAGGPTTISGEVSLSLNSVGIIDGPNSIDTMTCDGTSYAYNPGNIPTSGPNTCPSNGPTGITGPTGPQGEPGPQGIQGEPGTPGGVAGLERVTTQVTLTLGRNASRGLTATCPAGKVVIGGAAGTGDPTFAIISSGPGPDATTQWSANFWNTAFITRTRAARVTAICAFAQ